MSEKWNEEDLLYAAGFLDGEGCFNSWDGRLTIACENTYKPVIEWFCCTFGGKISKTKPRKKEHRVTYRWAIYCENARIFCEHIAPYLREKCKQACLLIALRHLHDLPRKKRKKFYPEILIERKRLNIMLKEMKHETWE